jgi:YVTN family beta-propeller protein
VKLRAHGTRRVGCFPIPLRIGVMAATTIIACSGCGSNRSAKAGEAERTVKIAVGGEPFSVAVGEGGVWVTDKSLGIVSRIDPATNRVTKTIKVGPDAAGVATGGHAVWVAIPSGGSVARLDPSTNSVVAMIGVGRSPTQVAVGSDAVWVGDFVDNTVSRINPATNRVTAKLDVGTPRGIAASVDAIWVANFGRVSRIDTSTKRVIAEIPLAGAETVASGDGAIWVTDTSEDQVVRIDPATNLITAKIDTDVPSFGGLAVTDGSGWVANLRDSSVSRFDPASNRVTSRIKVGNRGADAVQGIAVGRGAVWVASYETGEGNGTVTRINF